MRIMQVPAATDPFKSETYATRLKILFVHNRYQFDGGEDEVVERERQLLVNAGHQVVEYNRDNREINEYTPTQRLGLALRTIWAWDSHRDLLHLLETEKPDVVHCHNTFPLVSPAVYYACAEFGVPVVQSLHNPRLICPAATLYRDGSECQQCCTPATATHIRNRRWCPPCLSCTAGPRPGNRRLQSISSLRSSTDRNR